MTANVRHSLVTAATRSGLTVMEKSASATPEQKEILDGAWPSDDENITKQATLARILATGAMVEEAEMSLAENAA